MAEKTAELKSYSETIGKPLISYMISDPNGKSVQVMPKNPSKHKSGSTLEAHPTYFYNVGTIVQNPDSVVASSSKNPRALENAKQGKTYIYRKEGFVKSLKLPWIDEMKNEQTLVIVFYGDDGVNFTRSYRSEIKTS
ncbi:MAG TPA: hypothetical protein VJB63_02505 [Patescibacteria group bacterium]|nr:hypothetical protein [Patescibacteria group bacterium]